MSGCGTRIVLRGQKPLALCDRCPCFGSLFPPLAALTFAASVSYTHLEEKVEAAITPLCACYAVFGAVLLFQHYFVGPVYVVYA